MGGGGPNRLEFYDRRGTRSPSDNLEATFGVLDTVFGHDATDKASIPVYVCQDGFSFGELARFLGSTPNAAGIYLPAVADGAES